MAGNGPLPQPAAARRRRNVAPGARTIRPVETPDAPELPFEVTKATSDWWAAIWASPMASEWLPSDVNGLYMLADLMDSFWTAGDAATKAKLSTEIRLQSQRYGLSPIDRKRLAWDVAKPSSAATKPASRRDTRPDPRLKEV